MAPGACGRSTERRSTDVENAGAPNAGVPNGGSRWPRPQPRRRRDGARSPTSARTRGPSSERARSARRRASLRTAEVDPPRPVGERAARRLRAVLTGPEAERMLWERLQIISVEDVGLGRVEAPVIMHALHSMHAQFAWPSGDRFLFAAHAIRLLVDEPEGPDDRRARQLDLAPCQTTRASGPRSPMWLSTSIPAAASSWAVGSSTSLPRAPRSRTRCRTGTSPTASSLLALHGISEDKA